MGGSGGRGMTGTVVVGGGEEVLANFHNSLLHLRDASRLGNDLTVAEGLATRPAIGAGMRYVDGENMILCFFLSLNPFLLFV